MGWLFEGIKVGFILCLLVGPILFTLVQTSIEEGIRAGAVVGLGIWVSDTLFIIAIYRGITFIADLLEGPHFTQIVGIAGSVLLCIFGLGALLTSPKNLMIADPELRFQRSSSYASLWLKGFLINTINPFTVFFWFGLMSTIVVKDGLVGFNVFWFFTGILGTVIATDVLKIVLAKRIRYSLRPVHFIWVRKVSGIALITFGLALLVRVFFLTGGH